MSIHLEGSSTRRAHALGLLLCFGVTSTSMAAPYWKLAVAPASGPAARAFHGLAYDEGRGVTVLYGGYDPSGPSYYDDVWEYDGRSWTRSSIPSPGARVGHGMAYDSWRGRIVAFGGTSGTALLRDTWEYDGTAWTRGPDAPAGYLLRSVTAMTFDSARGRMVLFGGSISGNPPTLFDDTWEYDGTAWTEVDPPVRPDASSEDGLAFDAARARTVLFCGICQQKTWEFDGTTWSMGPGLGTGQRGAFGVSLAYDPVRQNVVAYGGAARSTVTDTWLYDGTAWTPSALSPVELDSRREARMAYDAARDRMVVFGGYLGPANEAQSDTWEYLLEPDIIAGAGAGAPNPNRVVVYTGDGTPSAVDITAYGAGQWGVYVGSGELDGGLPEILTGPGPGAAYGPQVRAFDRAGAPLGKVNYFAYGTLKYGVHAAGGNIDADVTDEMITTPGAGPPFGPHVRGFELGAGGVTPVARINFFAYSTLKYGASASAGDVDDDGYAELLTAPGPGVVFSSQVRGFNYDGATLQSIAKINFDAFPYAGYGAAVGGGDMDDDGHDEIAAAPGPGPAHPQQFKAFTVATGSVQALPGCDLTTGTAYGGRVALGDVEGDSRADLLTAAGPDPSASSLVTAYRYDGVALASLGISFTPFSEPYGADVASGFLAH